MGSYIDSSLIRVDYWQVSSIITAVFCFALLVRNNIVSIRLLFLWSLIALNIVLLIINPVADAVVVGYGGNYEAVLGGMAQYQSPAFSKFSFFSAVIIVLNALIAFCCIRFLHFYKYLTVIASLARLTWLVFCCCVGIRSEIPRNRSSLRSRAVTYFWFHPQRTVD